MVREGRFVIQISQFRRRQQGRDFRRDREGGVAGIFLPSILRAHRTVARQITGRLFTIGQNVATSPSAMPFRDGPVHQENGNAVLSIWIPFQ